MNEREAAAWEVHNFLQSLNVPYAIIGGMAVQFWGEPRMTQDVDLTVAAPLDDPGTFIRQIVERFEARLDDAVDFARRNRVILVRTSNGCPVDISMGLPGYEDEVMDRTTNFALETGKSVRICSAEDLIIHKAVAGRPQDIRDIESIVYRQNSTLDEAYIRRWLQVFAEILSNPEITTHFEIPWRRLIV